MPDFACDLLFICHALVVQALWLVAVGIAISGLDDLFIDLVFFGRSLRRRLTIYRRHPRATAQSLRSATPAPIAIIVPAWDEADVIGAMLAALLRRLDYPCYRVFVGLYPNDPTGMAAVAAIGDPRIQAVMCRRPGPTTKGDCLNHLWRAVAAHEAAAGMPFKAVVLHDAEDVIHPQELWIYDALIPRLAMVQLPVLPLVDAGSRWVAGHYLDEFAENHTKDVVVREALGAAVPSAGVACAIDRRYLGAIAAATGDAPFDETCLTEDYELGHRIKALGGRGALVRIHSRGEPVVVATREHFPATLDTAIRQKTRWLTGIALSGWDRLRWPGGWADRYMLLRDRKGPVAALLTALAYAVAALGLADAGVQRLVPMAPPLVVTPGLAALLWLNAALLGWRLLLRAGFTAHAYGLAEGLRAVPRALVSNLVNAAAAWGAARRYRAMLRGGAALGWDKTAHRFPGGGGA